jgi:hypothetical protein
MAIVKGSYTRSRGAAKANIEYITKRPGKDRVKITRTLFGLDGFAIVIAQKWSLSNLRDAGWMPCSV